MRQFGKRPAGAERLASPRRRRVAAPPRPNRDRSGLQLKSLARQDLAAASAARDELEYALDGLASRAPTDAIQRSAYDLVGLVAAELSSASFISSGGGLAALANGLRAVPSTDPLVGLCVAALLHALADGGAIDSNALRQVVVGTIHRLQLATADMVSRRSADAKRAVGSDDGALTSAPQRNNVADGQGYTSGRRADRALSGIGLSDSELRELWGHLECLTPLVAEYDLMETPSDSLAVAAQTVVQRICLEVLADRVRRSRRARIQIILLGGLRSVLAVLSSCSTQAALRQHAPLLSCSLELLQHATFMQRDDSMAGMQTIDKFEDESDKDSAGETEARPSLSSGAPGSAAGSSQRGLSQCGSTSGSCAPADVVGTDDDVSSDSFAAADELRSLSLQPLICLAATAFDAIVSPLEQASVGEPGVALPQELLQRDDTSMATSLSYENGSTGRNQAVSRRSAIPKGPHPAASRTSSRVSSRASSPAATPSGAATTLQPTIASAVTAGVAAVPSISDEIRPAKPRSRASSCTRSRDAHPMRDPAPTGTSCMGGATPTDPFDFDAHEEAVASAPGCERRACPWHSPSEPSSVGVVDRAAAIGTVAASVRAVPGLVHTCGGSLFATHLKANAQGAHGTTPVPGVATRKNPFDFDEESEAKAPVNPRIGACKVCNAFSRGKVGGVASVRKAEAKDSASSMVSLAGAAVGASVSPSPARSVASPSAHKPDAMATRKKALGASAVRAAQGDEDASRPFVAQFSPPIFRATTAAKEARLRLEHERSLRSILLLTLKVMVNLTNNQPSACEEVLSSPTALPLIAKILVNECAGAERRGGLPRHFDTALMCLGLLTNILEVKPDARLAMGAIATHFAVDHSRVRPRGYKVGNIQGPNNSSSPSTLLDLLATVLRSLLQPMPSEPEPGRTALNSTSPANKGNASLSAPASRNGSPVGCRAGLNSVHTSLDLPAGADSASRAEGGTPSSRTMEREIAGAYTALLLGFLCRDYAPHCVRVLHILGAATFQPVSQLLRSFLDLHASAGLLSSEGIKAMASVIEWMSAYGTGESSSATKANTSQALSIAHDRQAHDLATGASIR